MSSDSDIAIIQSKVSHRASLDIVAGALHRLLEHYDFGFRGYGGVLGLEFAGREYLHERELDEGPSSASDIDRKELERLASRERWFAIGGSIRIPEVDKLLDLDLILYPTFDPERPACVLFRLERDLYDDVWRSDSSFNEDGAATLFKLCVSLGAHKLVDGFRAMIIADLGDIIPFDGASLRDELLRPRSAREIRADPRLRHGFVTGVKRSLVSLEEVRQTWRGAAVSETTGGLVVVSRLVDLTQSA